MVEEASQLPLNLSKTVSGVLARGGSSFIKKGGAISGDANNNSQSGKMILRPANTLRNGEDKLTLNEGSSSLLKK